MKSTIKGLMFCVLFANAITYAAVLDASDAAVNSNFGASGSIYGDTALVGAYRATINGNSAAGAAYIYRNFDTASGTVTEDAKLVASDPKLNGWLAYSLSLYDNTAVVGAQFADVGGAAYIYRNIDTATGTVTENAKLVASDAASNARLGSSTSLYGNMVILGATQAKAGTTNYGGAAYLYRNIDTVTGTVTESAKLVASDIKASSQFGITNSVYGTIAVVGAGRANVDGVATGSAYLYRNLDTATGTVTESAKLVASDGAANWELGASTSVHENTAVVGARFAGSDAGAAYIYRNLDTATGTVTENAKLVASDETAGRIGMVSAISGNTVILGSPEGNYDSASRTFAGAAYMYLNVDTASGTITESVKLTASSNVPLNMSFGSSISIEGDKFVIGAEFIRKAYSGSVSSLTTLDAGNTAKNISGISFESRLDWIIGENTSGNKVSLGAGDIANVTSSDKAVYIGKNAASNNNELVIAGKIETDNVFIGSADGNSGNILRFMDSSAYGSLSGIYLTEGNDLAFEWAWNNTFEMFDFLGDADLHVWDSISENWVAIDENNYLDRLRIEDTADGGMLISINVPEPSTYAAIFGALALALATYRRRK